MNNSAKMHASYNLWSRFLHWIIALAIALNYWLAERAEHLKEQGFDVQALAALANHKSVGMTIFTLALVRLAWRQYVGRPMLPGMPAWQLLAANATHYVMYIVLIGLPLTGWLGSSASAYSVSWFNLFVFPDVVVVNEVLADQLFELHHLMWIALQVLLLLHVAAAFKHGLYNGDGVFSSMWNWRVVLSSLLLIVALAAAVWQLQQYRSNTGAHVEANAGSTEPISAANLTATDLQLMAKRWQLQTANLEPWDVDHAQSLLGFEASQAGAQFAGEFTQWQGRIVWSADDLDVAGFDVQIDLGSVNTQDDERDGYLRDVDFFSIQQFPQARFLATWVRANAGLEQPQYSQFAYVAEGYLQMKGLIKPVQLWFNIQKFDAQSDSDGEHGGVTSRLRLQGEAQLNRHLWQIGQGEWADDEWIGPSVTVRVDVVSKANPFP